MNTSDKDRELMEWMKGIRLESPGPEFSSKVMKIIQDEKQKESVYISQPMLGKNFWIMVILFVAIVLISILIPVENSSGSGILEQFFSGLPKPGWDEINRFFSGIAVKSGSLSLTLAAVMLGATALILLDNHFTRNHRISPT
jgi:hypothetical protein